MCPLPVVVSAVLMMTYSMINKAMCCKHNRRVTQVIKKSFIYWAIATKTQHGKRSSARKSNFKLSLRQKESKNFCENVLLKKCAGLDDTRGCNLDGSSKFGIRSKQVMGNNRK